MHKRNANLPSYQRALISPLPIAKAAAAETRLGSHFETRLTLLATGVRGFFILLFLLLPFFSPQCTVKTAIADARPVACSRAASCRRNKVVGPLQLHRYRRADRKEIAREDSRSQKTICHYQRPRLLRAIFHAMLNYRDRDYAGSERTDG